MQSRIWQISPVLPTYILHHTGPVLPTYILYHIGQLYRPLWDAIVIKVVAVL